MKNFFNLALIFAAILSIGSCKSETAENRIAMHTLIQIRAEGFNSKSAVEESFNRIAELEKIFEEDLNRIESNADKFVEIHSETFELLEESQKISEETQGSWDITIGSALKIWDFDQAKIPSEDQISQAKNLVDFKNLTLDKKNQRAKISRAGVKLDLGGIAKGFAADEVRKIFDQYQIRSGLIQIGASTICAVGKKSDGSKWKIGLKNPRDTSKILRTIELEDQTISTSGDYEKFFISEGIRYHHILDPKTCAPVQNGIASVSVIVPNSMSHAGLISDAYSTASFVNKKKVFETIVIEGS